MAGGQCTTTFSGPYGFVPGDLPAMPDGRRASWEPRMITFEPADYSKPASGCQLRGGPLY